MQNGYVGLLDVLGFSELVSSTGNGRLSEYLQCLQEAFQTTAGGVPEVDYVVFSDSIVVTGKGDTEASLQAVVRQCSRLFGTMLERGFALRGAVSYGAFLRAESNGSVFVAGRPVVEAYKYETNQNWVGIMLSPSVVRRVETIGDLCRIGPHGSIEEVLRMSLDWAPFLQPFKNIPFHTSKFGDESEFDGYAIVPTIDASSATRILDQLDRSLQALKRLKSLAPDPASQAKYRLTFDFVYQTRQKWESVCGAQRHFKITP